MKWCGILKYFWDTEHNYEDARRDVSARLVEQSNQSLRRVVIKPSPVRYILVDLMVDDIDHLLATFNGHPIPKHVRVVLVCAGTRTRLRIFQMSGLQRLTR